MTPLQVFEWSACGWAWSYIFFTVVKFWFQRRAATRNLLMRERFMKNMEEQLITMFAAEPDCQCPGCTERRTQEANEKRDN